MQNNPKLIQRAIEFAAKHHADQLRKQTGLPYIYHCMMVSELVSTCTDDSEIVAAAVLHDVIEDTDITSSELSHHFGDRVTELVLEVTNLELNPGSRAERVQRNIDKLAKISAEGQLIKACDTMHNLSDLKNSNKKDWAKMYASEKSRLLDALTKAPELIVENCREIILDFHMHHLNLDVKDVLEQREKLVDNVLCAYIEKNNLDSKEVIINESVIREEGPNFSENIYFDDKLLIEFKEMEYTENDDGTADMSFPHEVYI